MARCWPVCSTGRPAVCPPVAHSCGSLTRLVCGLVAHPRPRWRWRGRRTCWVPPTPVAPAGAAWAGCSAAAPYGPPRCGPAARPKDPRQGPCTLPQPLPARLPAPVTPHDAERPSRTWHCPRRSSRPVCPPNPPSAADLRRHLRRQHNTLPTSCPPLCPRPQEATFSLGERGEVLDQLDKPAIIPHVAEHEGRKFSYEVRPRQAAGGGPRRGSRARGATATLRARGPACARTCAFSEASRVEAGRCYDRAPPQPYLRPPTRTRPLAFRSGRSPPPCLPFPTRQLPPPPRSRPQVIFRNVNKLLVDTATSEYVFCCDFFDDDEGLPVFKDLFAPIVAVVESDLAHSLQARGRAGGCSRQACADACRTHGHADTWAPHHWSVGAPLIHRLM
jgi:hypothetical protein